MDSIPTQNFTTLFWANFIATSYNQLGIPPYMVVNAFPEIKKDLGIWAPRSKKTNEFQKKRKITSPKFNIAPEKWWLEDYFPIGKAFFQGLC